MKRGPDLASQLADRGARAPASVARLARAVPCPAGEVARELPRDAAAARPAPERPLQRLGARRLDVRRAAPHLAQPVRGDLEIAILVERIKRHTEPEPLGKGDLIIGGIAGVDHL